MSNFRENDEKDKMYIGFSFAAFISSSFPSAAEDYKWVDVEFEREYYKMMSNITDIDRIVCCISWRHI